MLLHLVQHRTRTYHATADETLQVLSNIGASLTQDAVHSVDVVVLATPLHKDLNYSNYLLHEPSDRLTESERRHMKYFINI